MRYHDREIAQMYVFAEQGAEKLEQADVREHLRPAEVAGHARRDIVARAPYRKKPVRRRLCRLLAHCGPIQRPELRDILAMHGLDGGGGKRSTQQNAAVLMESGMSRAVGFGSKLPAGGLA